MESQARLLHDSVIQNTMFITEHARVKKRRLFLIKCHIWPCPATKLRFPLSSKDFKTHCYPGFFVDPIEKNHDTQRPVLKDAGNSQGMILSKYYTSHTLESRYLSNVHNCA